MKKYLKGSHNNERRFSLDIEISIMFSFGCIVFGTMGFAVYLFWSVYHQRRGRLMDVFVIISIIINLIIILSRLFIYIDIILDQNDSSSIWIDGAYRLTSNAAWKIEK